MGLLAIRRAEKRDQALPPTLRGQPEKRQLAGTLHDVRHRALLHEAEDLLGRLEPRDLERIVGEMRRAARRLS
jgi:hypothetical protein